MKKIFWPGIVAGALLLIIGMGLNYLLNLIFPPVAAEYNNTAIFRPWNDPLMSIFFAYPIVLGIILAWVWDKTKILFSGNLGGRALNFAIFFWLIASIPGMIITYGSFQVSLLMVIIWLISGFINGIIAGLVFGKMNK